MVVIGQDKRPIILQGRLAVIVGWLVENDQRVATPDKVQIVFDCAGGSVSAEVKQREKVTPARC